MKVDKKSTSPSRIVALQILGTVFNNSMPFEQQISTSNSFKKLTDRDKRFCRLIITEVIRHHGQIDLILKKCLSQGIPKSHINFLNILRIGVAELLFIKSTKYAAVNDAVELVKNKVSSSKSGVTNAVLRRIDKDSEILLKQFDISSNFPKWLLDIWRKDWGELNLESILYFLMKEAPLDISVAGDPLKMANILQAKHLQFKTVRKDSAGDPSLLPHYFPDKPQNSWWIQDAAAAIPAELITKNSSQKIVDVCAAPGGKSFQLAANGMDVISIDINSKRMKVLESGLERTGLTVKTIIEDALTWIPKTKVDAVLIDAPCTATGTIRRHPDILINRSEEMISDYQNIQKKLLSHTFTWIKSNGIMIYSVCSLQKQEGEDQILELVQNNKNLEIYPILPEEVNLFKMSICKKGWLRIFPNCLEKQGGNDGFFICRLKRVN